MRTPEAPRRLQQKISVQQVGAETLVYDEHRHKAFCLNESSSVIWSLCDGEKTCAEIAATASLQLKVSVDQQFVEFAVAALRKDGLLEPCEQLPERVSRRAVLESMGTTGVLLLPAVAAILAPTAAQAYSGCFDCTSLAPSVSPAARSRRLAQAQAASGVSNDIGLGYTPFSTPTVQSPVAPASPAVRANPGLPQGYLAP